MKYFTLNNGNKIPAIGFGTYTLTDESLLREMLIECARCNYELLDTAYFYKNETLIGKILKEENLENKFQIATKVWPIDYGKENTKKSIERSLKSLNRDYIDIMYLHWPGDDMEESWKVLEDYYEQGIFKNIAVCNFYEKHMDRLLSVANVVPQIDQVELHPLLQKSQLLEYLKSKDIQPLAWSPIAKADKELFENEKIIELSNKYNKIVAQIILAWHISRDTVAIPRTSKVKRISENIDVFDFKLSNEDMEMLKPLDIDKHTSNSPLNENWLNEIRYGK
ncbi:aldo/keto reductase [Anaerosphaera multitolerans]|uniref:Aldo/keto reductase n=1 Tax=Anaerosphaera multitolerans TaxID=2487351 RepID=A0A437S5V5_9FIRM|nr:aldo/keto reductase [Anaerosphaera multitolerans]RVU54384.1 aldo/keto reductase [Anaerosphaera multitolerans]